MPDNWTIFAQFVNMGVAAGIIPGGDGNYVGESVYPKLTIRTDVVEIPFNMLTGAPRIPVAFPSLVSADETLAKS